MLLRHWIKLPKPLGGRYCCLRYLSFIIRCGTPSPARVVNHLTFNSVTRRLGGRFYAQFIDYVFGRTSIKSNLNGNVSKCNTLRHKNIFPSEGKKAFIAENGSRHCRVWLISHECVTTSEYGQKKTVNFIPPVSKNKCSLVEILTIPKQKLLESLGWTI